MKKLRFGILGAANIARKNWAAILDSGNAIVTAVASRDAARGRRFIQELQAKAPFESTPVALGSYEELLDRGDVDAVYIPLPTGLRKEWVLRAAAAGKHVICEKPCGVSAAEVREMTEACAKNGVQFMDGVMFVHHPRQDRIRSVLEDGKSIGQVTRIMSNFCFHLDEKNYGTNVRLNSRLEPAGCLGDLGWYCIRFALWTMDWRLPREVTGRILAKGGAGRGQSPVPVDFSGELIFDNQTSAGFYCSFIAGYQHWVHVSGDKGWLRVDDFVHPRSDAEAIFEMNRSLVGVKAAGVTQQARMIRNFAKQVFSGKLNREWPESALKTQQVLDACLAAAKKGEAVRL
jgi:predicted dehydrogenase